MNIFAVNADPRLSAIDLCDKHVVKMILETTQILCTAHRVLDGLETRAESESGRSRKEWILQDPYFNSALYAASYVNHPCTVWARENSENYNWLLTHGFELVSEYNNRFGQDKVHKCSLVLNLLKQAPKNIKIASRTNFAQAMPDRYRQTDSVDAYRNYYAMVKFMGGVAKWNKSSPRPTWVMEHVNEWIKMHRSNL